MNVRALAVIFALLGLCGCNEPVVDVEKYGDHIPIEGVIHLNEMFYSRDFVGLERIIENIQAEIEADPGRETLMLSVEDVFWNTDEKAREIFDEWVEASPQSWVPRLARGLNYKRRGWNARGPGYAREVGAVRFERMEKNFNLSRDDLRHALEMNPKLTIAYMGLVDMARGSGLRREKQEIFRRALIAVPETYIVRKAYLVGLQPQWGGSWLEVSAFGEQALEMQERNPLLPRLCGYAHFFRGYDYFRQDEFQNALIEFSKAVECVRYWGFLSARAKAYIRLGELELALDDANEALEQRHGVLELLMRRAYILMQMGEYEKAGEDIEKARGWYPLSTRPVKARAQLSWYMNNYEQAEADYTLALESDQDDAWALKQRGRLRLHHIKDYDGAARDLLASYSHEPSPKTWYDYASALYLMEDDRTVLAFEVYLDMCTTEDCLSKNTSWAKNFIGCVYADAACTWKSKYFSHWKERLGRIPVLRQREPQS